MENKSEHKLEEITNLLKHPSKDDLELISKAFKFSEEAHRGQKRFSGEPYFSHPFETARTLARLQLDASAIAAGLLHDVCEDCLVTGATTPINEKIIKKEFGEDVAFLVNGVTKLGSLKYRGKKQMIENLRKMFLAMAKDIRVILIKLADRLHNMKTLEYVPKEKQERIAIETLEIYAPLANRLGMGSFKGKLEDLAFPFVYPEEYKKVKEILKDNYEKKEKELIKIKYKLAETLKENGFNDVKIDSRVKHLYSLFKKLQRPGVDMNIKMVYDLIALRVVADNVENCYKILGIIHQIWRPLPGRIKDYISVPKPNGYQSLHTTVFADGGNIIEIQIRTAKMHDEAEYGIAAHWAYDEGGKPKTGAKINPRLGWINQLVEWQKETQNSKVFLERLRIDFFKDRVFCFTPRGDVIDLPEGATAIDFAFAVHTEIGSRAMGANVNNKFISINSVLKNGDVVEILTQKNKKPSMEWLGHAKTSLARKQIKQSSKDKGFFK